MSVPDPPSQPLMRTREPASPHKLRVLFVAEAVTLAHVARPAYLAERLNSCGFSAEFASAGHFRHLLGGSAMPHHRIDSIPPAQFLDALAHGRPLHDAPTLRRYVQDDLRLLEAVRPDVVVGDLRQSLSISARRAGVPYVAIVNAYWSPFAKLHYSVPSVPATRWLPIPLAEALFHLVRPFAFRSHCAPMNQVRREFAFPALRGDLRQMYTDADFVVYPDTPELIPMRVLPGHHRFIGPILWSPAVDLPVWWDRIPRGRPVVYLSLGSSGHAGLLHRVARALAHEPVTVLAATVESEGALPDNVLAAPYLDGRQAARRADLVISNGGSLTAYQALAEGKPVLGLPANMDQHLSVWLLSRSGAGLGIRSERASERAIRRGVRELLDDPRYTAAAQRLQASIAAADPAAALAAVLQQVAARSIA